MELETEYPDYGTIQRIKVIDSETFFQGEKTLSAQIYTVDYRTDRVTMEKISKIITDLHNDPTKLDVSIQLKETKNGAANGYFVVSVSYKTVKRV